MHCSPISPNWNRVLPLPLTGSPKMPAYNGYMTRHISKSKLQAGKFGLQYKGKFDSFLQAGEIGLQRIQYRERLLARGAQSHGGYQIPCDSRLQACTFVAPRGGTVIHWKHFDDRRLSTTWKCSNEDSAITKRSLSYIFNKASIPRKRQEAFICDACLSF
jgi:hypothetical protein